MWHTSEGDRILTGSEARLFRSAVLHLVEQIKDEPDDPWICGIHLFDELTWSQKLAVLESVATHLLTHTARLPKLVAVNEAAIGSVFEHISFCIDQELHFNPDQQNWRQLVLDACHESFVTDRTDFGGGDEDAEDGESCIPVSASDSDKGRWATAIEMLADRILWDRDYQMMGDFLDEPPEKAAMLRQILGIDDEYFATVANDLTSESQVEQTLQRLRKILV